MKFSFERVTNALFGDFRNKVNQMMSDVENNFIETTSNTYQAQTDATKALNTSDSAVQKSENVQSQLNTLVVRAGESSPQVLQALTNANGETFETLKGVLDDKDRKIGNVTTQVANIQVINVKDFGVVGDFNPSTMTGTDDTAALQAAFSAADGKRIIMPDSFNCKINNKINLPSNVTIDFKGKVTCVGDQDYWFSCTTPKRIIYENIRAEVTLDFGLRTKLNRVLYCNIPTYFEVKVAEIIGSSTAIHCLNGDDFICGDITLKNVYGTAAQYGYGVNTSAKRTTIKTLNVVNDNTTHGRHAIYINGSQWQNVDVGYIYVKNFNKNPINIANTDINAKCNFHLGTAVFINANMEPTVDTTGCINGTDENGSGVKIVIDNVRVNGIGGCAVSSNGVSLGQDGFYIGNVYAENLAPAYFANTALVHIRYGNNKQVGKVVCTGLNTNWLCAVYLRDTNNAIVDDVYVSGTSGSQAVRMSNSTVLLGNIDSQNIPKVYNSGSTIRYKYLTTGTRIASASGTTNTLTITHGLGVTPTYHSVQKACLGLPAIDGVIPDATYLNVTFVSNVPAGTNHIVLKWSVQA
ncbi:hypothetical protein [Priestia megaterium]|uniref:hypothetical protein n=1 Tax=Priestia megaterium TaxID=1404 RepID=UPI000CA3D6D8|nr:hypothetical protein [Priestia megaterium]AUO14806.1 hypothetical protein C0569_26345 [Priestia megaterium]